MQDEIILHRGGGLAWAAQAQDPPLAQDVLLARAYDLLLVQEEDLQEENIFLVPEEDLLLVR